MSNNLYRTIIVALGSALLTLSACMPTVGQSDPKKEEKKEAMQQGTPVFWQEPSDIASRNLLLGPGGEEMKPDLKQVIWEESLTEGYSVKWRVRDVSGRHWVVKLGNEAQPETVATRLVWAAGYPTEVNYLVPCVQIVNAPQPRKKVERDRKSVV